MDKLISILLEKGQLKKGGRVLCVTDGCAKQYKSSSSINFLSLLAFKYGLVIDRVISYPGHGKSLVDGLNGIDKNKILRWSQRKVQAADKVSKLVRLLSNMILLKL